MSEAPSWLDEPGVADTLAAGEKRAAEHAGFDPEELAAAVHALTGAVDRVNRAALGSDLLPLTDLATLLDAIRQARQDTAAVESILEVRTAKAMAEADLKTVELEGVGFVEWRRGGSRKSWDHDDLAAAVLDRHLDDRADGELPTPWEVRDWLLEAAHTDYWRAGVLRGLGLDPDDYSATTPGKLSVQITRPG